MRNNSFALKPVAVAMFLLTVRCFAQPEPLPLKHGNYVQESYSCTRPPFAAMMSWDGIGFSGPHSSRCTTRVLVRHENRYSISTSCAALGDGSPDNSKYVDSASVTLVSNTRFQLSKRSRRAIEFRWCSVAETEKPK